MDRTFSDSEAARRLLNRLARDVAAAVEDTDYTRADHLLCESAYKFLKRIASEPVVSGEDQET